MVMPDGRIPIAEEEGNWTLVDWTLVEGSEGPENEHERARVLAWAGGRPGAGAGGRSDAVCFVP